MDEKMIEKVEQIAANQKTFQESLDKRAEELDAKQRDLDKREAEIRNNPVIQRQTIISNQTRSIINDMMEKRAITLSGSGAVEVVNELFKVFRNKTGILEGVRFFQGPNAQTKIPVLSPRPALPVRYAEGATSVTADSTAALGATVLEPETYVAVLPVSWETLKYSSYNFESELYTVLAECFVEAMATQMVTGRGKTTYYEFAGLYTSVPSANQIACAAAGAPTIADLVKLALTMQTKVMSNPTIVISPTLYAGITAATVSGYDVYKNELIMNRTIEGVKVEVTGYAPSVTTANAIVAVGFDKNDYAIGIGSEIIIDPIKKVGDTNTYYQAAFCMDGKPIVAANTYALKAIS